MEYVDYAWYSVEYNGELENDVFDKHSKIAFIKMDIYTTGIDGFKKLVDAFPDNEYDIEAIKICACGLIDLIAQVDAEKRNAAKMHGVTVREDGSVFSNRIASVSSGTESISYAANAGDTAISEAIKSMKAENELYFTFINDSLSGISDKNGVNLLYMGKYPYRVRNV